MRKKICLLIAIVAIVFCMGTGCAANTEIKSDASVISYGLCVLAAETDVAVWAPIGNDVVFSADCFARGLNLAKVDWIMVRSLPDPLKGQLLLGSVPVAVGQTVSAQNLSLMSFVPETEDYTQASFTFTANGGSTPLICNVYLTGGINYTPTVSMASGISLNGSTPCDSELYGKLSGFDPDGDELIFEVVSYPKNGSVLLLDRNEGSYVYKPCEGYEGEDCFSYVVRDRYGNYSAMATVNLTVTQKED